MNGTGFVVGDPIDAARVRASVRARLFGGAAAPVKLGRLELGERIGVGAMGVVYEARDPELDRRVAVKVLRPGLAAERLQGEARALGKLRHQNVVAVHDVGVHDGHVYLVMERVDGESLRRHLAQPRPWRAVVELFVAVARGVAAAHAVGLVHRDVKPDNVLVDSDGEVKVVDFGLSVPVGAEAAPAGTPAYLAPEVQAGAEITAAADQYAIGAALGEAIQALPAPDWLRRIVTRMTAPAPADRFPSVAAAAIALSRGLERRRRWLGLLGAGLLVTLGATVAIAIVQLRAEAPATAPPVCPGRAAELAGAWNPERRTAMVAALGEGTAARLDRYAASWLAMDRSSCLATRSGAQSSRALDLRARCLDRLRGDLGALVDGLLATEVAERSRALAAAVALTPLASCTELTRLEAATPLPDQPARRAAIGEVQAALAAAWAEFRLGHYAAALAAVEPLRARATEIGWRPLEAEVLLLLGQAYRHGHKEKMEDTLFAAVTAGEAGGHIEALVTAQALLAQRLSVDPARQDESQRWIELGLATVERAGDAPLLRALVLDNQGRLQARRGDFAAARRSLEAAVAEARRVKPLDEHTLAMSLHNLGIVLSELGERTAERAVLEESLTLRERSVGPDHPVVAELLNALADTLYQQRDLDGAATLYERAVRIATASSGATSEQALRYQLYWAQTVIAAGDVELTAGRRADARALYTQALSLLEPVPDSEEDREKARDGLRRAGN